MNRQFAYFIDCTDLIEWPAHQGVWNAYTQSSCLKTYNRKMNMCTNETGLAMQSLLAGNFRIDPSTKFTYFGLGTWRCMGTVLAIRQHRGIPKRSRNAILVITFKRSRLPSRCLVGWWRPYFQCERIASQPKVLLKSIEQISCRKLKFDWMVRGRLEIHDSAHTMVSTDCPASSVRPWRSYFIVAPLQKFFIFLFICSAISAKRLRWYEPNLAHNLQVV